MKKWLFFGSLFGLTAVGAGAYGWHMPAVYFWFLVGASLPVNGHI